MMAQDTLRKRIRAAREDAPQAFHDMLADTLDNLPQQKRRAQPRYVAPIAAAIALALALTLAGPPIASAAVSFFERLFALHAQQLNEEQARPAEERAQEMADEIADYGIYNQTFDDNAILVEGIKAQLVAVQFRAQESGGYEVQCTVGYSDAPSDFDPAWIDYTLTVNGTPFAPRIDEGTEAYRREGLVGDDGGMLTPWQYEDGIMKHYLFFPVGQQNLDTPLDISVSAKLHTVGESGVALQPLGELKLNCVFDREIAIVQEVQRSRAAIPLVDEYLSRTQKQYEALALEAVPINASYEQDDVLITVSEMSVMDGQIFFTVSGVGELEKTMMVVESIRIDGKASPFGGRSEEDITSHGGAATIMHSAAFPADPRKLPDESVICVQFSREVGGGAAIFRYNWETRAVTLPVDAAESAQWLADENTLAESLKIDFNRVFMYDIGAVCEKGGAVVTLDSVSIYGTASIDFTVEGKALGKHSYTHDCDIVVDGLPVTQYSAFGKTSCQFSLPMHPSELPDVAEMTVSVPLTFEDGTTETFDFAFSLIKSEAQVYERPQKR